MGIVLRTIAARSPTLLIYQWHVISALLSTEIACFRFIFIVRDSFEQGVQIKCMCLHRPGIDTLCSVFKVRVKTVQKDFSHVQCTTYTGEESLF